jgi:putrescine transport system permease protein
MNAIAEIGDSVVRQINRRLSAKTVDRTMILLPYLWLLVFFLAPIAIIMKISFADPIMAQPPYTPMFNWAEDAASRLYVTLDNYLFVFQDRLYMLTYWSSVKIAFISTVMVLLVGYPMAYAIARAPQSRRSFLLMLVILPFWTSFLLRVYAWLGLLNTHGLLNTTLLGLGIIDAPLEILYTNTAVYLGIIYSYLPFMILPLYASLEKLDGNLLDAAADLGARPARAFLDVTLPLSMPGIIAGSMLVFIPAMGEYVIPTLLGGPDNLMIGRVLYDEFFYNMDWPLSSAIAIVLLTLLIVPIMVLRHYQDKEAAA